MATAFGVCSVREAQRNGTVSDLVRLLEGRMAAMDGSEPDDLDGYRFAVQRVRAGVTLSQEGGVADRLFVVLAGSFKCVKVAEDGYEHVLRFAGRGTAMGFDGLASGRYASSLVALEDSAVYVLPAGMVAGLRHTHDDFDAALQRALYRELAGAAQRAGMMAPVVGEARLARFLVALSDDRRRRGESPSRLLLRMCRRDIGNHLGLAHETISRAFTALAAHGCLRVRSREIEIVDLPALRDIARCTRGREEGCQALRSAVTSARREAAPLPEMAEAA